MYHFRYPAENQYLKGDDPLDLLTEENKLTTENLYKITDVNTST